MNAINVDIVRSLFMPLFLGTTVVGAALVVMGTLRVSEPGAVSMIAGGGLYVIGMFVVPPTLTAPDPSLGEENQTALQPTTGKMWVMTGGVWTYLGLYRGFNARGAYDNAATYSAGDYVSSAVSAVSVPPSIEGVERGMIDL
ncbi:putative membrane protein [Bradyrhizobium sp. i1.3.6]